eukprot:10140360-Alexandrium_andersonii.AAC.1
MSSKAACARSLRCEGDSGPTRKLKHLAQCRRSPYTEEDGEHDPSGGHPGWSSPGGRRTGYGIAAP